MYLYLLEIRDVRTLGRNVGSILSIFDRMLTIAKTVTLKNLPRVFVDYPWTPDNNTQLFELHQTWILKNEV